VLLAIGAGFYLHFSRLVPGPLHNLAWFLGNRYLASLHIDAEASQEIKVYRNNKQLGATPYSAKLMSGTYQFELRADGRQDLVTNVMLVSRTRTTVKARLPALPINVVMFSNPIGAEVFRDGKPLGKTPMIHSEKPGPAQYVFRLPGYEETTVVTNVVGPDQLRLEAILRPMVGWLELSSDPPGAEVFRDGKRVATRTPALIQETPGIYHYELIHEGFEPLVIEDGIQEGKTNRRSYVLKKSYKKEATSLLPPPTWPTIRVQSDPPGAEIWRAGERTGKLTPDAFRTSPGMVSYLLKLEGYEELTVSTNALEGQRINLAAQLKPLMGTIVVSSNPIGADIFEGDQFVGKTPSVFTKKPAHVAYTIKLEGYEDQQLAGNIRAREQATLEAALAPILGRLNISSQPPGAEILQDGTPTGKRTPATLEERPRNAAYEFRLDDYDTVITNAIIQARSTRELKVSLVPRFRAITNSIGMELVLVRNFPGSPKTCWVGKSEVSQDQYQRVMKDNPSPIKNASLPVVNISWSKAREFCQQLTEIDRENLRRLGLKNITYELPTESQWEFYVADAKLQDAITSIGRTDLRGGPEPSTGQVRTNRLGIADVIGNVWEFCTTDSAGPVWRGGAFDARLPNVQHYRTIRYCKGEASKFVGFRVIVVSQTEGSAN
jgi:hypothetical protein